VPLEPLEPLVHLGSTTLPCTTAARREIAVRRADFMVEGNGFVWVLMLLLLLKSLLVSFPSPFPLAFIRSTQCWSPVVGVQFLAYFSRHSHPRW
jgi:hypothetical protein